MKNKKIRNQIKRMKKQKQNFLKLIKNNYNVYDSNFLLEIIYQYIKDLYEYHYIGDNVWCSKEEHDEIMKYLSQAYNIVLNIEKIDNANTDFMEYSKEHDQYIHELFQIIADHYNEWWD